MAQTIAVVVYEPAAEASLARWLIQDVLTEGMRGSFDAILSTSISSESESELAAADDRGGEKSGTTSTDTDAYCTLAEKKIMEYVSPPFSLGAHSADNSTQPAAIFSSSSPLPQRCLVALVVVVYWDALAEVSKASFIHMKQLTEEKSHRFLALKESLQASARAEKTAEASSSTTASVELEVLIQAFNAKKGEHAMKENVGALLNSLSKKLTTSKLITKYGRCEKVEAADNHQQQQQHVDPNKKHTEGSSAAASAAAASMGCGDISAAALGELIQAGQGECFVFIAAETREALESRVAELRASSASIQAGCSPVLSEPREVPVKSSAGASTAMNSESAGGDSSSGATSAAAVATVWAQEFLLRHDQAEEHIQMRLAMCGNVDSGKSTLTSVLTRGCRDDGRGFARAFVFNHKHEAATGRTSSISENHLGFSRTGSVVNYQLGSGTAPTRQFTPQELATRSAKVFTLYDLAGHEKYLKTTVLGMTRNMPDYSCVVISANNGIQRMTKEHMALCLALKIPFFVVVTRIDATPENVLKETLTNINKLLKIPTVRKLPYPVRREEELILAAKNLKNDRITPIFEVSNVTGEGVTALLKFLNFLPTRKDWLKARLLPKEMIIDNTFFVTGVGTIVGGIITQGSFHVNDTLLLGPDTLGNYRPVSIKSIHVKGVDSTHADAGNDAALCLKKERRSAIRKGNVLCDPLFPPSSYWQFEAEVTILYHSTTISTNYEPVIHASTVRQSARITYVAQEILRTGDRSLVRFHFLYRPEYMHEGQRLIFREGRTKGIGIVTKLIVQAEESLLVKTKVKKRIMAMASGRQQQQQQQAAQGRKGAQGKS